MSNLTNYVFVLDAKKKPLAVDMVVGAVPKTRLSAIKYYKKLANYHARIANICKDFI